VYIKDLWIFQQIILELGNKVLLAPIRVQKLRSAPGEQVLIKSRKKKPQLTNSSPNGRVPVQ
jgi:hypothetical protein